MWTNQHGTSNKYLLNSMTVHTQLTIRRISNRGITIRGRELSVSCRISYTLQLAQKEYTTDYVTDLRRAICQ